MVLLVVVEIIDKIDEELLRFPKIYEETIKVVQGKLLRTYNYTSFDQINYKLESICEENLESSNKNDKQS